MSKKKRNRQKNIRVKNRSRRIYPQKQKKKPIDKKAFMKIIKIVQKWIIDRCKGAINSIVENLIGYIITACATWLVYKLIELL